MAKPTYFFVVLCVIFVNFVAWISGNAPALFIRFQKDCFMQESLLHYIWQFQYFDRNNLRTTSGDEILVFNPGHRNTHAGPDFSNARVRVGDIEWIGNVEIHIHSSGWTEHKHHLDAAYDNVILHVVWSDDKPVVHNDKSVLPTLELKGRVADELLLRYNKLLLNPEPIPCSASISNVHEITRLSMFEKALMSRLEAKAGNILQILSINNNDWEETCYQMLCRNFGFKVNSEPMFSLARAIPYRVIMKHADKLIQTEAVLFGQAGLLEESGDETYLGLLKREYHLLSQKFDLSPKKMNKAQWKFLRLRPANFPTIRLAQLAALLFSERNIFSKFIEARSGRDLVKLLSVTQSEYWTRHYLFARPIEEEIPGLGQMSVENIIVNTVVPLMVAYGKSKDDQDMVDRAVNILQEVSGEENSIIRKWNTLGIKSKTAFDSQALIELHNNFCLRKRCLDCSIGSSLVRPVAV
jgi:hypothetical protein